MKNITSFKDLENQLDKILLNKLGWIFERFFRWLIKIVCKILDINHSSLMNLSAILSLFFGAVSVYLAAEPYWVKNSIRETHIGVFLGIIFIFRFMFQNFNELFGIHNTEVKKKLGVKDMNELNEDLEAIRKINNGVIFIFLIFVILSFFENSALGIYMFMLWFSAGFFLNLATRKIEIDK